MYGIVLGVTPPDALRKMNSDNNVCSTLTSNIMNEHDYVRFGYLVRYLQVYADRESYEIVPSTTLGLPRSSGLGLCHEYVFRPRCV